MDLEGSKLPRIVDSALVTISKKKKITKSLSFLLDLLIEILIRELIKLVFNFPSYYIYMSY